MTMTAKPKNDSVESHEVPITKTRDLNEALSSAGFAYKINMLHQANAKELMYLKLNDFLSRTNRMLGMEDNKGGLNYIPQAKDAVERINKPLIGSIYDSISAQEVAEYASLLSALPTIKRDKDYQMAVSALLRAASTQHRVSEEYPGFQGSWDDFYGQNLLPVFEGLPNLVMNDPDRWKLFESLAGVATGRVDPQLEEYREYIELAHDAFKEGDLDQLSDAMFALASELVHTPPPEPPGEGDNPCEEGDSGPGEDNKGGGKGDSSSDVSAPDEDEGPPDDSENEEDEESEEEEDTPPSDGSDEEDGDEDGEDPFESLAQYMDSMSKDDFESVGVDAEFKPPDNPEDLDLESMVEMQKTKADIGLPVTISGTAWVYFEAQVPPHAREDYHSVLRAYNRELIEIRRIIDEHFRTNTIIERGLRAGRVDQTRLHRAAFNDADLFKQEKVDSVGHMDLVVLLDESGSMFDSMGTEGFKLDHQLPARGHSDRSDQDIILGKSMPRFGTHRYDSARILGMLLLEAARHLPGFNVQVIGYHSNVPDVLGPLKGVGEAVAKKLSETHGYYGTPILRKIGSGDNPYPIMSTHAYGGNSDAEALAYAVDYLRASGAEQKGIIYLADGHVYDNKDIIGDLLKKSRTAGIQVHFMNLTGSDYNPGGLSKIPSTLVTSPKDMVKGLQKFLHRVVASM